MTTQSTTSSTTSATSAQTYVALARRYRPWRFADVIGQEHVTRTLENALREGRAHHAYLFTGSRGVGKTTVARILARELNGLTESFADGANVSVRELEQAASIDVIEIDGASHTGVDDIRELRENVRYLPAQGRYKIYIIDEVHMLSTSAFNALLKTLEEPPSHVVFVFATTEPHKIPATILSRCQRFDFKRVPLSLLVEHLTTICTREQISIELAALSVIAKAAQGGVRDALSLLDQSIAYAARHKTETSSTIREALVTELLGLADKRVLFALMDAILSRNTDDLLQRVKQLYVEGHDLEQVAHAFLAHIRDLIVAVSCDNPLPLLDATVDELEALRQQGQKTDRTRLQQTFEQFSRSLETIARSSTPRMHLEIALIDAMMIEPALPLGELLERLSGLEKQLGGRRLVGGGAADSGPRSVSVVTKPELRATTATQTKTAPPPSSITSSSPSSVEPSLAAWKSLFSKIETNDPRLASLYGTARLLRWEHNEVELGFPAHAFEYTLASDPQKREQFRELCARLVGKPLAITIRSLRPDELASDPMGERSAISERDRARQDRKKNLDDEVRNHPVTRQLVEQFGATIEKVIVEDNG